MKLHVFCRYCLIYTCLAWLLTVSSSSLANEPALTNRPTAKLQTATPSQPRTETTAGTTGGASKSPTFSIGVEKKRSLQKHHAIEKLDLGNFNLFNGNTRQAMEAYKAALAIDPDNWEAHYGLCNCYVSKKKYSQAIEECRDMLALRPSDKNTMLLLGNLLKNQGRLAESIQILQHAERLGAKSSNLHTALGLALAQSNRLDEAMQHLTIALAQEKKGINPDAHLGKAVVLYKQGNKEEALPELDKAIKGRGGNFPQARNFKAEILLNLGRVAEAKAEYLIQMQKEDTQVGCFQALGNIYLKEEQLDEALKIFDRGIKWYPRDADLKLGKAVTLEKQGKLVEAMVPLRQSLPLIKEKDKLEVWKKHLADLQASIGANSSISAQRN
jgi:tetratricopeptide (TPR) repeat protein